MKTPLRRPSFDFGCRFVAFFFFLLFFFFSFLFFFPEKRKTSRDPMRLKNEGGRIRGTDREGSSKVEDAIHDHDHIRSLSDSTISRFPFETAKVIL